MQAEERLGLVAQEKDFLLVDEFGYGALDHALLNHNLELEIWFCSHGARFHQSGQLEVLSECVKTSDYVALERRLRAGADVSVPWLPDSSGHQVNRRWLQHRGFVVSVRFGAKVVDLNGRVALDWCSSAKKKTTTVGKAENVLIEVVLKIDWGWISFLFLLPDLLWRCGLERINCVTLQVSLLAFLSLYYGTAHGAQLFDLRGQDMKHRFRWSEMRGSRCFRGFEMGEILHTYKVLSLRLMA